MNAPLILLAASGCLVAAGIAMSFYGSAAVVGGLVQEHGEVGPGEPLTIEAHLDPAEGGAVFAVQAEREGASLEALLTDPSGIRLADASGYTLEERFEPLREGTHTLHIETAGDLVLVSAALGHEPDDAGFALGAAGFYALMAGLVGMAAFAALAFLRRPR